MRRAWFAAALLMGSATAAHAQQASTFLTGVAPSAVKMKPINTSNALRPTSSALNAFHRPSMSPLFSASNMAKRIPTQLSLGAWPPTLPNVFTLPQSANIFQPNPPKGVNPFNPKK